MQMSEIAHPSVFVHTLEPVAFVSTMPSCWQLSLSSEPSPDNPAQCGQGPPHQKIVRDSVFVNYQTSVWVSFTKCVTTSTV